MNKLTFYPLGNADCCLIETTQGKNILFDYGNMKNKDDDNDLRVDLERIIKNKMEDKKKNYLDIVAFTHGDKDHINCFSDIFYLECADKYQTDERIHINELWVPAAIICGEELSEEAKILRKEARYRLKNKKGIKVFSRPETLKDWFEEENLTISEFSDFLVDAGTLVPGLDIDEDGIEFFVHSPFASRQDDETLIEKNKCSIVVQICFKNGNQITKVIMGADTPWDAWEEIVKISQYHKNEDRLNFDIFKLPHHCSYLTLSDEKGKDITIPKKNLDWLFRQANSNAIIISTSNPIPINDTDQPPHFQAANFYKDLMTKLDGEFIVTMEHPRKSKPEPLEITIGEYGATLQKTASSIGVAISTKPSRRAG